MARYIITCATDDTYAPLTLDMLRSLRRLKLSFPYDIGIFDLGLSEASKNALAAFGASFRQPGLDIDYPGRVEWERDIPYYRAMTVRPFVRDYFPGYDAYMWVDADAWAQTAEAFETMLPAAASDDALYIAAEIDRDYLPYFQGGQVFEYHLKWYRANFPEDIVGRVFPRPMLNCGIRALSGRSPVWGRWADVLTKCLNRFPKMTREHFMSEQLALNVAVYTENLPYRVMPAEYNWLSLYCLPMVDAETGAYVRPTVPRGKISIIHITHQKKLRELELAATDGKTIKRVLTFSDYERNLPPVN